MIDGKASDIEERDGEDDWQGGAWHLPQLARRPRRVFGDELHTRG
jgi:hypothetical protein